MSPLTSGFMYCSCKSLFPNCQRISAFPESGAWEPNAIGAIGLRPRISFMYTYGMKPIPMPPASRGRCGAHMPMAFVLAWSSFIFFHAASLRRGLLWWKNCSFG
jgi:hypothetical protein